MASIAAKHKKSRPNFILLDTWVRFPSPAFETRKGNAGVAQSVEHLHGKEKVVGSIPTPSLF